MDWISSPEAWVALVTLTVLEIVLGIDNVIFISILSGKLPQAQQRWARQMGLALAMFSRIALLVSIAWIIRLTDPLFSVLGREISARDLILIAGGLFLLAKATREIHERLEVPAGEKEVAGERRWGRTLLGVSVQIALLDIVFSLDSVITAVGMADDVGVMVTAIVVAVVVMMVTAEGVSAYVERHPTIKMLALSFLLLIGMSLIAEGMHQHIPKGYIYFAMGFSVFVEGLNLRVRKVARDPLLLRRPYEGDAAKGSSGRPSPQGS